MTILKIPKAGLTLPNPHLPFFVDVVIEKRDGRRAFIRATLDTGSELNIVAESALEGLDCVRHPWSKPPLEGFGSLFKPSGEVLITWRIKSKETLYRNWFAVVDDDHARSFDMLIGRELILENQFFLKGPYVW